MRWSGRTVGEVLACTVVSVPLLSRIVDPTLMEPSASKSVPTMTPVVGELAAQTCNAWGGCLSRAVAGFEAAFA